MKKRSITPKYTYYIEIAFCSAKATSFWSHESRLRLSTAQRVCDVISLWSDEVQQLALAITLQNILLYRHLLNSSSTHQYC